MKYIVVNWIQVEPTHILVGVTDSERWKWETQSGDRNAGGNAKTHLWIILTKDKKHKIEPIHTVHFSIPENEWKASLLACISTLLDIGHKIHHLKMDEIQARDMFFGQEIYI